MKLLKKIFKPSKGTATIMLYCTMYDSDNVTPEDKKIVSAINSKMHVYCDKMIAYENSKQPTPFIRRDGLEIHYGFKTLQEVTVTWDMDNNDIAMWTSGVGHFSWKGKLDQFLTHTVPENLQLADAKQKKLARFYLLIDGATS